MPAPLDPECLFRVLGDNEVDYVLVGGLAAVLHGSPAMTNDADIVPKNEPSNLARLSRALRSLESRLRVTDTPEGVAFDPHPALLQSMAMLNMTTRCGDLDLTFAPAGLPNYESLVAGSIEFELEGSRVRVAALTDIIRSKEAADRAKDRATLPILRALAEEIDLANRDSPG
ncbi:MAG: hypothetical protein ACT4OP_12995 [Actinomycetota bacterium]